MKNFILLLILILIFAVACSNDGLEVVPQTPNTELGQDVGPFTLKLSTKASQQTNSFQVDIAQEDSGLVDFILPAHTKTQWIQFESYVTKVSGCDPSKVMTTHYWVQKDANTAIALSPGEKAKTLPNQEAKLSIYFEGLGECTEISYESIVTLIEDDSEIPKSWSAKTDKELLGTWIHKDGFKEFKMEVTETYLTFTDNSSGYCLLSHGILTDSTQNPRWLRADYSESELLCKYKINGNNLEIDCPNMQDWSCRKPSSIQLKREVR